MKRREFLGTAVSGLVAGATSGMSAAYANSPPQELASVVTILHTNDTHSRIDPYPNGKYKGMGGVARRAALIQKLRRHNPHTLVVDAGDIFQGTPYFNLFRGRLEIEVMSRMGYDISAIGNHDFDLGAAWFLEMAQKHAKFDFLGANLSFSQPGAEKIVQPMMVKTVGRRKIGFFGLGIKFKGLVEAKLHKGVRYTDPVVAARRCVKELRERHKCDAVVLLSHLGYRGYDGEPGDIDIPAKVAGIDVIIGGHTHTFLRRPTLRTDANGNPTQIFQVGHSGIWLGQIDLIFDAKGRLKVYNATHTLNP